MIALLTQDAASVSLNNAINTQSSVWAEIEEGAMHKSHEHKHKEHHHHHHEYSHSLNIIKRKVTVDQHLGDTVVSPRVVLVFEIITKLNLLTV